MKALVFEEPQHAAVRRRRRAHDRRGRGARALAQRRHLPLGLRALRGPLHHPRLVSDHPGPRVGGRDRGGRERRDDAAARATASSASASSTTATTTSASRSAAPTPSTSWPRRPGCTAFPTSSRSAQGAFVEPFSVAYSASVAAGGIDASDEVAVIGGGPIGLLCAHGGGHDGRLRDADRAAGASPRARARGRREAGDRSERGPARRAGGRGDAAAAGSTS